MRNSSFVLALRYCRSLKLVFTSFCFHTVPKARAYFGSLNNGPKQWKMVTKKAIIPYHLLRKSPFDVPLNSFIIWISDKEASRIIQSHHVTYTNERFFLTACRNTAAYCIIFLTVWNSWLRQPILKIPNLYEVSLSFRWNEEGTQAVKTKADSCFKAWRLFLFSSLFLSNMHYWPCVKSIWLNIWPNSFFCILLDFFLKVLYFFPDWLCCATSCIGAHFTHF